MFENVDIILELIEKWLNDEMLWLELWGVCELIIYG